MSGWWPRCAQPAAVSVHLPGGALRAKPLAVSPSLRPLFRLNHLGPAGLQPPGTLLLTPGSLDVARTRQKKKSSLPTRKLPPERSSRARLWAATRLWQQVAEVCAGSLCAWRDNRGRTIPGLVPHGTSCSEFPAAPTRRGDFHQCLHAPGTSTARVTVPHPSQPLPISLLLLLQLFCNLPCLGLLTNMVLDAVPRLCVNSPR